MTGRNSSQEKILLPMKARWSAVMVCLIAGLMGLACSRTSTVQVEMNYPAPRYPRYLAKPNSEDLLKAARFAVRQASGRSPLGKMQPGQTVHVFVQWGQERPVWEAIRQAWAERGVEAHAVGFWEAIGISEEEYNRISSENATYGNEAWKELGNFESEYKPFFPPDIQESFGTPFTNEFLREKYVPAYLDKHPEIEYIYAATGGRGSWESALGKHGEKFQGNWIYIRNFDLLNKGAEFPADVWSLLEEKLVRPIPFVSEVTFQDPEGTNLHWNLTPEEAQIWARSTGISNHLNVYPSPLRSTLQPGAVIAAHSNHTGIFPAMKAYLDQHGAVQKIEGGGRTGDLFRMLLEHPTFKDVSFPKAPGPGYWFLRQDGFATNPKYVRSMPDMIEGMTFMANLSERNRAGVQHLAFSYSSDDPADLAYAKQNGLPLGNGQHTAHMHNHFPTVKWRLRDTGEWLTVADDGYVEMFNDAEVRALASRYGDPELIFRYEWIPSVPGINVPGDYNQDFALDPWGWLTAEWKRIQEGTYQYFVEDYSLNNPEVANNYAASSKNTK